mmetsp:Transcript_24175/g.60019  ORF Transcript_24175/g.60019 Transcript_24175/m.60019 type:complete len:239 (-) Transcript_24175:34-750(-)|eukprot:1014646-Prymnesium_polylepis.1
MRCHVSSKRWVVKVREESLVLQEGHPVELGAIHWILLERVVPHARLSQFDGVHRPGSSEEILGHVAEPRLRVQPCDCHYWQQTPVRRVCYRRAVPVDVAVAVERLVVRHRDSGSGRKEVLHGSARHAVYIEVEAADTERPVRGRARSKRWIRKVCHERLVLEVREPVELCRVNRILIKRMVQHTRLGRFNCVHRLIHREQIVCKIACTGLNVQPRNGDDRQQAPEGTDTHICHDKRRA